MGILDHLTHFWPIFPIYAPLKHQKTKGFLLLEKSIKWKHWAEMG